MMRVGFIVRPDRPESARVLSELVPYLLENGHEAFLLAEDNIPATGALTGAKVVPEHEMRSAVQVVVVLGGDGTMLRASHLVAEDGIAILGINLGRLGFLTPFDPSEAKQALSAVLAGTLATNERMRICVTYCPADGEPITRIALNDAVIHQGTMARLIDIEALINDERIASYRADGLILATPTGSTAYSLAAGGPILVPGQAAMVLTPICAHGLTNRPLVIPHDATISMRLARDEHAVVLTVDGHWAQTFMPDDWVEIRTAKQPLIMFDSGKPYFDIMRAKLHWGVLSST